MILRNAAVMASLLALAPAAQAAERPPRPDVDALPVSANATRAQLLLGDRIFHGEAARGTCFQCHGWDGKGTATGNDLTNGSLNWGESFREIKATILNNMKLAPGQDGDLTPSDVDAVTAYVWALVHQERMDRQAAR
ncbi:MAG TPA: c-type cytochrome [Rhodoblastus sp.]|nr:c-type cytochrome [Rhodoblastus sp.]